jgi:hypothetical protein
VRVLPNEAAKVVGDERAAGSILVWNGLVTRMRRVSVEAKSASGLDDCARDRLPGPLVDKDQHAVRTNRFRLG